VVYSTLEEEMEEMEEVQEDMTGIVMRALGMTQYLINQDDHQEVLQVHLMEMTQIILVLILTEILNHLSLSQFILTRS
jgi:hypothetical protein